MWTLNETRTLAIEPPRESWLNPELLRVATEVADRHYLTGTQTHTAVEPDGDGDFAVFAFYTHNPVTGVTVATDYVHRVDNEHVARTATVAEVLAEMAHAAGFGDAEYPPKLIALVGEDDANLLTLMGSLHP